MSKTTDKKSTLKTTAAKTVDGQGSLQDSGANDTQEIEIPVTGRSPFVRIMAIIAIIILLSMYVISIIAAVSDWENSFEIFLAAASSTIILPVLIYIIQLFANLKNRDK